MDQMVRDRWQSIHFLVLFILGAILAGVTELPYGGWIQIPILSVIWWWLTRENQNSVKHLFASGLTFGLGYFIIGLWWIYISLHDVGGMNAALSCMAVILLSAYMALYFGLAALPLTLFHKSRYMGLFLAACWVAMEYLRGYIFTGFPWMGLAESQVNGPFAVIAPYFGGLGCTFLLVFISWQLLQLKSNFVGTSISLILVISLTIVSSFWGFTKPIGNAISVELIQGNFAQSLIFKPEGVLKQIEFYFDAMSKSKAELIIAPETAFPWPETNLPTGTLGSLQNHVNQQGNNLLFGVIGRHVNPKMGREFSNRALGLTPSNQPYLYDKNHLVPFGEFIPPGFHWFVNAFSVPLSDFARGGEDQENFLIQRPKQDAIFAAITICYEDVFGGELASRIRNSPTPTNMLINLTNLAWFGDSQASSQQLRLSQLRSLETGLPALRATNTGITSVLDPNGKILASLPEFTQASLITQVQAYAGQTPYVRWGNLPILSLSCFLLIWGFIRYRRF